MSSITLSMLSYVARNIVEAEMAEKFASSACAAPATLGSRDGGATGLAMGSDAAPLELSNGYLANKVSWEHQTSLPWVELPPPDMVDEDAPLPRPTVPPDGLRPARRASDAHFELARVLNRPKPSTRGPCTDAPVDHVSMVST